MTLYNAIGDDGSACPVLLSFDEVEAIDASFYSLLDENVVNLGVNMIPQSVKKQAISYQALIKRAIEEQELVKLEMKSVLNFNKHQHSVLTKVFDSQHAGIRSAVFMEGISTELNLLELYTAFQPYIGDIDLPSVFIEMAGMQTTIAETAIVQEIIQSEELEIRRDEDTDSESDEDKDDTED